jgi:hypothetical protein
VKDSFYEELECVFDNLLKKHMKVLLEDFNAKVRMKGTFKPTTVNETLHKNHNTVNFAISKNLSNKW